MPTIRGLWFCLLACLLAGAVAAGCDSASGDAAQTDTTGQACVRLVPASVNFGGKLVGQPAAVEVAVGSCGTGPLVVSDVSLLEGSASQFTLDRTLFDSLPVTIPANGTASFVVRYLPDVENALDANGAAIPDVGEIALVTNAQVGELKLGVSGYGVTSTCPVAVIRIQEGEDVIPQTVLHLIGDQSFSPSAQITAWSWSVSQPTGSRSAFVPNATSPNATFEVNVAGVYEFTLEVTDETGATSCVAEVRTVVVTPDEAIHVEVQWTTPGDLDQTDSGEGAGTDLDLHFAHEFATGPDLDGDGAPDPWFDRSFDCFWLNDNPNWGSLDPFVDDDPTLGRNDLDGDGPEIVNLNIPENRVYRIGVHYWSDNTYGPSFATVRVFIYSQLAAEFPNVRLVNHDMWNVATITWPSGTITQVLDEDGNPKITPAYQNPMFALP
ncbi:MAG: hypothetical protein ACI9MR_000348 [Myxococcota bacterium]|jgi:hypothetical protein